jgi:hypothetical protein
MPIDDRKSEIDPADILITILWEVENCLLTALSMGTRRFTGRSVRLHDKCLSRDHLMVCGSSPALAPEANPCNIDMLIRLIILTGMEKVIRERWRLWRGRGEKVMEADGTWKGADTSGGKEDHAIGSHASPVAC